jgi:hypothetical protein
MKINKTYLELKFRFKHCLNCKLKILVKYKKITINFLQIDHQNNFTTCQVRELSKFHKEKKIMTVLINKS